MLKETLLNLKLVVDNEYLDKYCELIETHKNDKKIKFETQSHHIIPQYFYTSNNLKINSKKENIVNLSHKNHALAHYYLCLCSVGEYVYKNECALEYIFGNEFKKMDKNEIIKSLDKYQEIFKDFCKKSEEKYNKKDFSLFQYDKNTLELINKYKTINEASRKNKISISAISACKNGRQYSAGGYIWLAPGIEPQKREISRKEKHINQYDKTTLRFIKEWSGVSEIQKNLKIVKQSIRENCQGKTDSYKGYIWRYVDSDIPLVIIRERKKRKTKKIYMFDLNGTIINLFEGSNAIDGFSSNSVQNCCIGKVLTCKNHIFLYEKDAEQIEERLKQIEKSKERKTKKVFLYDLKANFIQEFNSITEASEKTFVSQSSIAKSCYKKIKNPKKYIWCFEGDIPEVPKRKHKKKKAIKIKEPILVAFDKKTGVKIGEWFKFKDAVKDTGKSYSRIKNCCVKYYDNVDGIVFEYLK